jgi:hypothetical protein
MRLLLCSFAFLLVAHTAWAADQLVTSVQTPGGDPVPYVLTTSSEARPTYAVILMPGGAGRLSPRMQGDKLVLAAAGNFLIRSRAIFAEGPFVAASTDATTSPDRILAIVADLERRYPGIATYVIGTSRSTETTMALSRPLDGRVAGFVHTSSMNAIASLDPRKLKSRHLIVLHKQDACRVTKPSAGMGSHNNYGTELIEIEGGKATGDDCEASSHHGYNGVERLTIEKIKGWIRAF